MDPINDHIAQVCNRHNQPIVFFEKIKQMPNCLACLSEKNDMIPAETYQQKLKEIINKDKLNYINSMQLYQNIFNSILNYKNSLIQSLDKILQNIQNQMRLMDSNQEQFLKYIEQNRQERSIEGLEKQSQQLQQFNEQFKNQIKLQLDELQKKYLTSEQLITSFDQKYKIVTSEQILDWNKVECQVIKESSKKESKDCCAFEFNKENTVLVEACEKEIIVYQFINRVIVKELQRLTGHNYQIFCLYFMQQSNSFASGSCDQSIIIWEFDYSNNKWFTKQKLQEHTSYVYCILMNAYEDLLISGSQDKTIKLWKKIKNNWNCQQTIDIKDQVFAISLNEMENKLISCGYGFISIMEKENDDLWRIVQTINVSSQGLKLYFADGDQFVFQSKNGDKLEVYSYDKEKKQFQISQKVQIQQQDDNYMLFPCQYIKQLKMISVKHGKYLNLFKINQTGDYQLIQSIDFQSDCLFGRLTDDGKNLVTWDGGSKEIQLRKLKFIK